MGCPQILSGAFVDEEEHQLLLPTVEARFLEYTESSVVGSAGGARKDVGVPWLEYHFGSLL